MTLIKDKVTGEWKKVCEDYAFSWGFPGLVQQFAGASNKIPPHWLLCDGSEYDVGAYPELFDVIGYTYGGSGSKFKVPDYRECALVGAGENGTDTMEAHDVYDLGEFKDDQLQDHTHNMAPSMNRTSPRDGGFESGQYDFGTENTTYTVTSSGRAGLVTRGKRKGINYIIHI